VRHKVNIVIGIFSADNQLLLHRIYDKNYFGMCTKINSIVYYEVRNVRQQCRLNANKVDFDILIEILLVFEVEDKEASTADYKVHIEKIQKKILLDFDKNIDDIDSYSSTLKISSRINNTKVDIKHNEYGDFEIAVLADYESYISREDIIDIPQFIINQKCEEQRNLKLFF